MVMAPSMGAVRGLTGFGRGLAAAGLTTAAGLAAERLSRDRRLALALDEERDGVACNSVDGLRECAQRGLHVGAGAVIVKAENRNARGDGYTESGEMLEGYPGA